MVASPREVQVLTASLAAYIAVSVVVAVVRRGHKCEPYARHADYYYPAWRTFSHCFFYNLILLPNVLMPLDHDALLQLKMMLILGSPFLCAVIIFSYFGKLLNVSWWKKPITVYIVPFALITLFSVVLTLIPGSQLVRPLLTWFFTIGGVLSILYVLFFIMAFVMLSRAVKRFARENYSNPEDFPQRFAKGILWIPIAHVALSWFAAYSGKPYVMAVCLLLLSALSVRILLGALTPHRAKEVEQIEKGDAVRPDTMTVPLSENRKEEIVRAIRQCVEGDKAYLDSHLTLATLSRLCGVNRTYLSQVMSEYLGGFFAYINRCRLDYAQSYREQKPSASVEDVAIASGFGSRQSYYNARRQFNR